MQSLIIDMVRIHGALEIFPNGFNAFRDDSLDVLVFELTRSRAILSVQTMVESPFYERDSMLFTALLDIMGKQEIHNFGIDPLDQHD